ncbi:hypothetical protein [Streptomyces sp. CEV 2-1]|uniref:hypothetical protein n=1 Tax=Streptomyces sp. CEV 2-1 TaxID=2485153 RepID=UPI000F489456|nr:hypothetical protein [Streptomyces sp. CEV 2-1]
MDECAERHRGDLGGADPLDQLLVDGGAVLDAVVDPLLGVAGAGRLDGVEDPGVGLAVQGGDAAGPDDANRRGRGDGVCCLLVAVVIRAVSFLFLVPVRSDTSTRAVAGQERGGGAVVWRRPADGRS